MEKLFQQHQLLAAAEAMASETLAMERHLHLINILAAGVPPGAQGMGSAHNYSAAYGILNSMGGPGTGFLGGGLASAPMPGLFGRFDMGMQSGHATHRPFCSSPSPSVMGSTEMVISDDESSRGGGHSGSSPGVSLIFTRRRAGQKVRISNEPVALSKKRLQELFDLPLKEAASHLGISMTAMKKACRRMGLERWPYRKVNLPAPLPLPPTDRRGRKCALPAQSGAADMRLSALITRPNSSPNPSRTITSPTRHWQCPCPSVR